jgi:hypothetical protein
MNKQIILLALLLIPLVSAVDTYQVNQSLDLKVVCLSDTDYCSGAAQCNISVTNPQNNYIVENVLMSNNDYYHNYTLSSSQTNNLGTHSVVGICIDGVSVNPIEFDFDITYSGKTITLQQMIYYIFIILSLIGLIYTLIKIYQNLPNENPKDDYGQILSVSHLKYLRIPIIGTIYWLVVAITFIISGVARNYFNETIITNLFFTLFTILMRFSIPFLILIFGYLLIEIFRDKELQSLLKRGLPARQNRL